jgi:DNA-binding transcriptional LysR family regulator
MNLLQLEYFQTVAKYQHMTRAAEALHLAQPSLSKVIARLEEDLGVALFDRIGRQIKLNRYGKAFLNHVERIFLELEDGKRQLSDMLGNENSVISISFNNLYPFSKLLAGYLKLYPHTGFRQTIGSTAIMQQQLQSGAVDFCISSPPVEGDGIESISLFPEEIFLIVPHGHKFANRHSINLIEAAAEPFIALREGFGIRDLTESLCHQAGFTPKIVFESDIAINLIDFVNYNFGIALLPILQWSDLPTNLPVSLHINEPVCNRTTALSYVQGRYLSGAAKQFKDYLIDYFKNLSIIDPKGSV